VVWLDMETAWYSFEDSRRCIHPFIGGIRPAFYLDVFRL
jgi:hypothetical protein